MKTSLIIAFIFSLFIVGNFGAALTWNITVPGDWNFASNWAPNQVPGSGDQVTLTAGAVVNIPVVTSCDTLTIGNNAKVIITSSGALTANNITQAGVNTIILETGAALNVNTYFFLSGNQLDFINQGSIQFNPWVIGSISTNSLTNSPLGNTIIFKGTRNFVLAANMVVPSGFDFATGVTHTFESVSGSRLITFNGSPTIPSNGWSFITDVLNRVSVTFNNGATISGNVAVTNSSNTFPTFIFTGAFTVTQTISMSVIPSFVSVSTISVNGNFPLNFNDKGVTFNVPVIEGNTQINFNNGQSFPTIATLSTSLVINANNLNFGGQWNFNSVSTRTFTWPNAKTLQFNVTLTNVNMVFLNTATMGPNSFFVQGGGGGIRYTNSLVSSNPITYTNFVPVLDCTAPAKTFAITGTSSMSFPNGVTINGCTVSSTSSISVEGTITTVGGNTTLPAVPTISYQNSITFSASSVPTNSLYGITVPGTVTIPANRAYNAISVEVTFPSALQLSDNSTLNGAGLFTLNGGINCASGNSIFAKTAFPSGAVSIAGSFRVDWSGDILLRNTNLGGTGNVWFTGSVVSTKGISTISNSNFRFKGGVTLSYLYDQFLPDTGCQLVINSNGVTGTRVIEGNVQANTQSNIVFDDNINFNVSVNVGSSSSGAVTFRTSGQTQASITTSVSVTFGSVIYFNHTNFHFLGLGTYTISSADIYVQGNLNNPTVSGDAIVKTSGTLNVYVVSNSTFGETFLVESDMNTYDFDGNDNVASARLTFANLVTDSREIKGAYELGTDLIFSGNVIFSSSSTYDSVGSIQILGNSILLKAAITLRNKLILTSATTISGTAAFNFVIQDQTTNLHGLFLPGTLTINSPITAQFSNFYSIVFGASAVITGNGAAQFNNLFISGSTAVSFTTQSVVFNNVTFTGTASYTVSPVDNFPIFLNLVRSFVPLTVTSSTLQLNSATSITPTIVFTANPFTVQGAALTIFPGAYTVNGQWNNNAAITFQGDTTLSNTATFNGTGSLTFNTTLILSRNLTIPQSVTFGFNKNYIVTVANNQFYLTLTSTSVTVNGIVVSNGGGIISTSPSVYNYQVISGGGVINSDWTWTNSVRFGNLNVTGSRTLNFNLFLTSGQMTYFVDGVVFNGGTFTTLSTGDTPSLALETSAQTNVNTLLLPNILLQISTKPFTFSGTGTLTINGTVNCYNSVTFNGPVVFGYVTPTSANTINFKLGTSTQTWGPSTVSLQIYRTNFQVDTGVSVTVLPSLFFQMPSISLNHAGTGSITLLGSLTVAGTALSTSSRVYLGQISITSLQNNTLSNLNPSSSLTFISTTTPWVEPVVSLTNTLTQTLILNGPIRMNTPSFGSNSKVTGTARLAITNGLTVSNTAFVFGCPVQLYLTSASGTFSFTLSGTNTFLAFQNTPSLFNPLGYNLVNAMNIVVTASTSSNALRFIVDTPLALGDVTVSSGILRFSSGTVTSGIVNVAGNAVFWVDSATLTANQLQFNQNIDGSSPSNFFYTVSSANPPTVTTQKAVYRGIISINVVNFNWDGSPITAITATSADSTTSNFIAAYGTPGYSYSSVRSGNSMTIRRTANPTLSPYPTQSNGPSPAVNNAAFVSINFLFLAVILFFAIFN